MVARAVADARQTEWSDAATRSTQHVRIGNVVELISIDRRPDKSVGV